MRLQCYSAPTELILILGNGSYKDFAPTEHVAGITKAENAIPGIGYPNIPTHHEPLLAWLGQKHAKEICAEVRK